MNAHILRTARGRLKHTRFSAVALVLAATMSATACGSSDGDDPAPDGRDDAGRVTITLRPAGAATPDDLTKAREVLAARLDFAEIKNAAVRITGDTITIEAPGADRDILDGIARTGRLDFRPVLAARPPGIAPEPAAAVPSGTSPEAADAYTALDCGQSDQADAAANAAVSAPDAPAAGCVTSAGASADRETLLLGPSELTGEDLQSAKSELPQGGTTGSWQVLLTFAPDGAAKFGDITGRLAGGTDPANRFAVLLDGRVLVAPTVVQELTGGTAVITGSFSGAEAKRLAAQLNSGTLPVPLAVESTT